MRILPPLFPFVGVVGGDGQITNWGVKPHVEHLQWQQERETYRNELRIT